MELILFLMGLGFITGILSDVLKETNFTCLYTCIENWMAEVGHEVHGFEASSCIKSVKVPR